MLKNQLQTQLLRIEDLQRINEDMSQKMKDFPLRYNGAPAKVPTGRRKS